MRITIGHAVYDLADEYALRRFLLAWRAGGALHCWRWRVR